MAGKTVDKMADLRDVLKEVTVVNSLFPLAEIQLNWNPEPLYAGSNSRLLGWSISLGEGLRVVIDKGATEEDVVGACYQVLTSNLAAAFLYKGNQYYRQRNEV